MKRIIYRILSLVIAAVFVLPVLSACGKDEKPEITSDNTTASSKVSEVVTTSPDKDPPVEDDYTLEGEVFVFLGSSVTYGSANGGVSFVEYIAERNNCTCTKYAISGTTLVDNGDSSYVQRLKTVAARRSKECDHFICQLSTNDATQNKPLGVISDSYDIKSFDTSTITGAMEYIIAFAKEKWDCPVSFYTNPPYNSAAYKKMVDRLYELQEKWDIGILDFWNDPDSKLTNSQKNKYMSDSIHPTAAGYLEWWTPKFEEFLLTHHR
ncbi:MAG: SGNH/GDSL hydrolase family protein [Clostridia bacterium]|nr:SGNH/GDSL hydrolase family protein [Clostridia bacterium]